MAHSGAQRDGEGIIRTLVQPWAAGTDLDQHSWWFLQQIDGVARSRRGLREHANGRLVQPTTKAGDRTHPDWIREQDVRNVCVTTPDASRTGVGSLNGSSICCSLLCATGLQSNCPRATKARENAVLDELVMSDRGSVGAQLPA